METLADRLDLMGQQATMVQLDLTDQQATMVQLDRMALMDQQATMVQLDLTDRMAHEEYVTPLRRTVPVDLTDQ